MLWIVALALLLTIPRCRGELGRMPPRWVAASSRNPIVRAGGHEPQPGRKRPNVFVLPAPCSRHSRAAGAPGTFSPRHKSCRPALARQAGWPGSPPARRSRRWRNGFMAKKCPRAEWPPAPSSQPAGSKMEPEYWPGEAGTTSAGPLTAPDQGRRRKGSQNRPLSRTLQLYGGLMFWSLRDSL